MEKLKIDRDVFENMHQWLIKEFGERYENVSLDTPLDFDIEDFLPDLQDRFFPGTQSVSLSELLQNKKLNSMLDSGNTNVYNVLIQIKNVGMLTFYIQNLQKILPIFYRNKIIQDLRNYFQEHFESRKKDVPENKLNGNHKKALFSAPIDVYLELAQKCNNFKELLVGEMTMMESFKNVFTTHVILLNALDYLALESKDEDYDKKMTILRSALLVSTTKMSELFAKMHR
ncbi:MAG: hypothetical protein WD077_09155 [Bacteroidia bacterium]